MTDPTGRSPKRVHILASINPLPASLPADKESSPPPSHRQHHSRKRSHSPDGRPSTSRHGVKGAEKYRVTNEDSDQPSRATKFRFKSKSKSHRSHRSRDDDRPSRRRSRSRSRSRSPNSSSHRSHRSHRRSRHHRHHRRRSASPAPNPEDEDPHAPTPLDPDVAFREALFDAMADDEGAAYWEGVYGQPLHVYERDGASGDGGGDGKGELERMTDEEYAEYVRQRMWEKTHAGLLEAQAKRKAEREARREGDARAAKERERVRREVERSLRRGEERRAQREQRDAWDAYVAKWTSWDGRVDGLPWPVERLRRGDVGGSDAAGSKARDAVRAFFVKGLQLDDNPYEESAARLKEERVRWHPDKMQQKLGGKVDANVMRDVTAIFQIVDQLWNDIRSKAARGKA